MSNAFAGQQKILHILNAALECSVFVAPIDPGLTLPELVAAGKAAGLLDGEIGDAIPQVAPLGFGRSTKILPSEQVTVWWSNFGVEDPDYRNLEAFDFVLSELNHNLRSEGKARAKLERSIVVERGVARGLAERDIQLAITMMVMLKPLDEKDRFISLRWGTPYQPLPSEQRAKMPRQPERKPYRAQMYPIVEDLIGRRTDGRPQQPEPLTAFADELDKLGYATFKLWWKQMVAELRRLDTQSSFVSVAVISAALVEGALTFVVKHARSHGLMKSTNFDRDPRTWRIEDLVSSASPGGTSAILTDDLRKRADSLIAVRQRIHAGRMLSEFPDGPPDLKPEQARDAKQTAELVVRGVLDWLQKFPPAN